jgi:hypothetical protein
METPYLNTLIKIIREKTPRENINQHIINNAEKELRELTSAFPIDHFKKIVMDKKEELSNQLNELPKNDNNAETIRKKQMLTHSILVLRTILDKI